MLPKGIFPIISISYFILGSPLFNSIDDIFYPFHINIFLTKQ
jgi:hypothetical protein